jgi:hypothetical protein
VADRLSPTPYRKQIDAMKDSPAGEGTLLFATLPLSA